MPTIDELKIYLGIDGGHLDPLLADFLRTAEDMVEKILRYPIGKLNPLPSIVKEALKYCVGVLYANRENADLIQLERTLVVLLSALRKKEF